MSQETIICTIDCTPTWEGLLPLLLTVYEQQTKKRGMAAQNAVTDIKTELRRMAQAADRWNAHCKECNNIDEPINGNL